MPAERQDSEGGFHPEQFIAELESQLRAIEAAGGEAPAALKAQLERMKQLLAEGQGDEVRMFKAGDSGSGFMGFSVPVEPGEVPRDSEYERLTRAVLGGAVRFHQCPTALSAS